MKDDDGFEPILSMKLTSESPSVEFSFPVPDFLKPIVNSQENIERGLEYYLLARYAYMHNMNSSFLINSFWSIEHFILSILVFKYPTKESLLEIGGFHKITKYWKAAKVIFDNQDLLNEMSKFDNYIAQVMGYFSERYPDPEVKSKKRFKGSRNPRVAPGGDPRNKALQFDRTFKLNLQELDHFVNFMLHDVTKLDNDGHGWNLSSLLLRQKNIELYKEQNEYSIIYPGKKYSGEMNHTT